LADIGDDRDRLDPEILRLARDRLRFLLVRARIDDDIGASRASFSTVARPILRPEPVTSATFPSRLPMTALPWPISWDRAYPHATATANPCAVPESRRGLTTRVSRPRNVRQRPAVRAGGGGKP